MTLFALPGRCSVERVASAPSACRRLPPNSDRAPARSVSRLVIPSQKRRDVPDTVIIDLSLNCSLRIEPDMPGNTEAVYFVEGQLTQVLGGTFGDYLIELIGSVSPHLNCLHLFDRFECGFGTADFTEELGGGLQHREINGLSDCWLDSFLDGLLPTA